MKHKIIFAVLFFAIQIISAQNRQYIDVWAGAGYGNLMQGIEQSRATGGAGLLAGAGYEFNFGNFMLLTGAEFSYISSKTTMKNYSEAHVYPYEFNPDYFLTYNYSFSKFDEKHNFGYVNVPLIFGYKFNNKFYGALGAKVGFNLLGNYNNNSTVTTTATDPQLIEELDNLPQHFLSNADLHDNGKLELGMSVSPTIEFGYILDDLIYGKPRNTKGNRQAAVRPFSFRAAVFADYDLLNLNNLITNRELISMTDAQNPLDVKINGLLRSNLANNQAVNSLMAGVKLTVAYNIVKEKPKPKPKPRPQPKPKPQPKPRPVPPPVFYVRVLDAETNNNLLADVLIVDSLNKEVYNGKTSAKEGLVSQKLAVGQYKVNVSAEGYLFEGQTFAHTKLDTLTIALNPIKPEVVKVLENLFFGFNQANLLPESEPSLNDLYQFLTDNPDVSIQLIGHTDNVGTRAYNQTLSENRAKAVRTALIEKGIDASRITAIGKGSSEPVDTNDTEEGRAKTRR
ncbi:MAG: OmpA family protein, partial [Paludibacter sp.]|nr:OmpA family protein [Paludibacter sp.]